MGPRDYYMHADRGPHVFGLFLLVLVVLAVAGLVVYLVRSRTPHTPAPATPATAGNEALELARLRYARGEIDRDAFLQLSHNLAGVSPPG